METQFKHFYAIGIGIIILVIAIIIVSLTLGNDMPWGYETFELTPYLCEWMLDTTPEEFCKTKGSGTELANGYSHAMVNKDGNLVLKLTKEEIQNWKNSEVNLQTLQLAFGDEVIIVTEKTAHAEEWFSSLGRSATNFDNISIAKDYTEVIDVYLASRISGECAALGCLYMQVFEHKPLDAIKVEYVAVDSNGNIKFKKVYTAESTMMFDANGESIDEYVSEF